MTSDELRKLRRKLGCTQMEMAVLLHCSYRMYQYYEHGKYPIPALMVEVLKIRYEVYDGA